MKHFWKKVKKVDLIIFQFEGWSFFTFSEKQLHVPQTAILTQNPKKMTY